MISFISGKNFLLAFGILASVFSASAQSINWQNTIGGTGDDKLWRVSPVGDGGVFCVGFSKSGISGDKTEAAIGVGFMDYWVMKLDAAGNIVWQNTIGGSKDDYCLDGQETADGGYILAGHSFSPASGDKTDGLRGGSLNNDMWVVKLNNTGTIEWQKAYGGYHSDYAEVIHQTPDGGYIVAGNSASGIGYDKTVALHGTVGTTNDVWILKLSSTGTIEWQQDLGGDANDYFSDMILTSDGGYLVASESYSGATYDKSEPLIGDFDNWLIKLDALGNIEWEETIGGTLWDYIGGMAETVDGNFVIGAYSNSGISGDKTTSSWGFDYWVYKIDTAGNIIWQNTLGGTISDFLYGICATSDNGVLIIGESNSPAGVDKDEALVGGSASDYWIIKLNQSGGVCWQEAFGGSSQDVGRDIYELSPTTILAGGYSYSQASGDKTENNVAGATSYPDYWVMELTAEFIPAAELCNGYDDDCDGTIDEGIVETITISAAGPTSICQGSSVVLTATYSGTSVQWKKNGVNIFGATSDSYTANQTGLYSCSTSSACATATSTEVNVTVNKNPKAVITAGGPTTFCAGGSVTLSEAPSGGCTYQWYKGGSAIAGATSTSYVVTTAGNYKCRVTKTATGCFKNSNSILVAITCKEGEEISGNQSLQIFPNPASNSISLSQESCSSGMVFIYTQSGALLQSIQNWQGESISVADYASGMYFIRMISGDTNYSGYFVKE